MNFASSRNKGAFGFTDKAVVPIPQPIQQTTEEDAEFNALDILAQMLARKWRVIFLLLLGGTIGAFAGQLAPNEYRANSLAQIQQRTSGVPLPSEVIGELIAGESAESSLETEFHIIKSGLILEPVVEEFGLDLRVEPLIAPVIGDLIVRRGDIGLIAAFADVLPAQYARAGDSIDIESFLVSDAFLGEEFALAVLDETRFRLITPDKRVIEGQTGETLSLDNDVEILVAQINAPAGRVFLIQRDQVRYAAQRLSTNLAVSERRNSEIVDFALTWPDAEMAYPLLNAIVESYKRQNLTHRSAEIDQSIAFIERQLPEVRASIEDATEELSEYQQNTQSDELSLSSQNLLEQAIRLEAALKELEFREEMLLGRLNPDHPDVQSLRSGKQQLQTQLDDVRGKLDTLPGAEGELVKLTARVERARELELLMSSRIEELSILKASAIANIRVLETAQDSRRAGPNRRRPILVGLAGGLALAALWILLGNRLRQTIDDMQSIEDMGLATFGTLSKLKELRGIRANNPRYAIVKNDPTSIVVEAFRGLRTGLQFSLSAVGSNCVMITSCAPADGKSFVSLNLSLISAQAQSRVLLIDCDLRRGELGLHFNLNRKDPGLSDFLTGSARFEDVIHKDEDTGLEFIATGRYPPNPAELLSTTTFSDFVSKLRAHYDLIILDAPPVLPVTDPGIIGQSAGLSLMVVQHLKTTKADMKAAQKSLAMSGVHLSGVVMNRFDQSRAPYGKYGTQYGYYASQYKYTYTQRDGR